MVLDIQIVTSDKLTPLIYKDFSRHLKKNINKDLDVKAKATETKPNEMGGDWTPIIQLIFGSAATTIMLNGLFSTIKEYWHYKRDVLVAQNETAKVTISRTLPNNVLETITFYSFDEAERLKFIQFASKDNK